MFRSPQILYCVRQIDERERNGVALNVLCSFTCSATCLTQAVARRKQLFPMEGMPAFKMSSFWKKHLSATQLIF